MSGSYLLVYVIGFILTFWKDRRDLKQAKKSEKGIYWGVAILAIIGFICRYANIQVTLPTELLVHTFAPWFHQFIKT